VEWDSDTEALFRQILQEIATRPAAEQARLRQQIVRQLRGEAPRECPRVCEGYDEQE
jgi:hypothetical protein